MDSTQPTREMKAPSHSRANLRALRSVAALEFLKGLLVVAAGLALLSLSRRDLGVEFITSDLLHLLHLNPDWHISVFLLRTAARLQHANHTTVMAAFIIYPTLRFVEAYGLWRERAWAEWFALISGSAYLPFEIASLAHKLHGSQAGHPVDQYCHRALHGLPAAGTLRAPNQEWRQIHLGLS